MSRLNFAQETWLAAPPDILGANARKLLKDYEWPNDFRVSTFVATAIEIGRIVGGLFSRDQRADRNETKRRQKEDAALLHRFKTQDADRARAAAALVSAARTRAETTALPWNLSKKRGRTVVAGNEITHIEVRFWH
jgi:hypothetical protein